MSSLARAEAPTPDQLAVRAVSVRVDDEHLWVETVDGRALGVPLARFDWLRRATPEQRRAVQIDGGGYVLLWDELDEAISVPRLFGLST